MPPSSTRCESAASFFLRPSSKPGSFRWPTPRPTCAEPRGPPARASPSPSSRKRQRGSVAQVPRSLRIPRGDADAADDARSAPPARLYSNPSKNLEALFQRRVGSEKQESVVGLQRKIASRRHDGFSIADRGEENRAAGDPQLQLPEGLPSGPPVRSDRDEL